MPTFGAPRRTAAAPFTQSYLHGRLTVSGVSCVATSPGKTMQQYARSVAEARVAAATSSKSWRQDAQPVVAATPWSRNGVEASRSERCVVPPPTTMLLDALKPVARSDSINSECSTTATDGEMERSEIPAKDAVIVFDWDDTLLPTTALQCAKEFQSKDLEIALGRHARLVEEVLRAASDRGHVSIVTLSERPWVEMSAKRYFPNVDFAALFHELDISVHYASEYGQRPQRSTATLQQYLVLKRNAMAACLTDRISAGLLGTTSLNMLSIGDSVVEQEASKELVASFASWLTESTLIGETVCKTMKFKDEPSLPQLEAQLRQLLPALPSLAQGRDTCDFAMEVATKQAWAPLKGSPQRRRPPVSTAQDRSSAWTSCFAR